MWVGVGLAAVALAYLVVRGPARVTAAATATVSEQQVDATLEPVG
jgi:hypothetical protein